MKSSSHASEKARIEKQCGEGAPPGEAKIALSCRRELDFQDTAKQQEFLRKLEIAVSWGRECQMEEGWGDGPPPGEAQIALSCRRELNFEDTAKQQKIA